MTRAPVEAGRVLVIKLGALGDFIQALGPMRAIRDAHPDAEITLLTTAPFAPLGEACGLFDAVWTTVRTRDPRKLWALRRRLIGGRFEMIYDLQTSDRSSLFWRLMWPRRPKMSGIARGCSHPHDNPARDRMHTAERQRDQLARAGIADVPAPDLSFIEADLSGFDPPERFALLVPGGAAHRPEKRWPVERFAELARRLAAERMTPVLIGAGADATATGAIKQACAPAVDLTGRTDFLTLGALARRAALAVGNDTGPMHLFAAAGCPSLVLYGPASDPALCGQRGPAVDILRVADLGALDVETVLSRARALSAAA
ncbi:MAG: glycosyltransferase family 9 protein [Marivibrio sp.]|uniref:glycosyltransferase family 9 protein n=1 Tax=Marivibrio sp. TaxID=2039719 RepID=UPI0032EC09D3